MVVIKLKSVILVEVVGSVLLNLTIRVVPRILSWPLPHNQFMLGVLRQLLGVVRVKIAVMMFGVFVTLEVVLAIRFAIREGLHLNGLN